jgi:hypothetical protein
MEGRNRFTPAQINKALRLLRELPVKDGRKSIRETLRLLEQGMKDALEKGYSRGEIRHKIAEAEIVISSTTLKGFLAEEQPDAGQKPDAEKSGRCRREEAAQKTASAGREQRGEAAQNLSPGSIIIKPDTPKEDL